jgi:hypothetical protein
MIHFTRIRCRLALLAFLIPLASPVVSLSEPPPAQSAKPAIRPQGKPIRLFNGATLDGYYTWLKDTRYDDPSHVFRVTDGMLHVTGDGLGSLITNAAYKDYHLVLEYKWGEKTWQPRKAAARDSGLLIHSNGADGGFRGTWMPSIEVQIIEGGVGDFILVNGLDNDGKPVPLSLSCEVSRDRDGEVVWKEDGKREVFDASNRRRINWFGRDPDWTDTVGFRGERDVDSLHGHWTRLDVIADGGHLEVYVNGTKVNEAFDASPREGKIQIQSELAEIFYRRWELWPLGEGPKPAPANNDPDATSKE